LLWLQLRGTSVIPDPVERVIRWTEDEGWQDRCFRTACHWVEDCMHVPCRFGHQLTARSARSAEIMGYFLNPVHVLLLATRAMPQAGFGKRLGRVHSFVVGSRIRCDYASNANPRLGRGHGKRRTLAV